MTRAFFSWCVGRAILERSPCDGIRAPTIEETRDRVLTDVELASVLLAARAMGAPYGAIVEMLALTGQRREEVAQMTWAEVDLVRRLWKRFRERAPRTVSRMSSSSPIWRLRSSARKLVSAH